MTVVPANAGTQNFSNMDSRLRGNDRADQDSKKSRTSLI
jgi:hypothetical protein